MCAEHTAALRPPTMLAVSLPMKLLSSAVLLASAAGPAPGSATTGPAAGTATSAAPAPDPSAASCATAGTSSTSAPAPLLGCRPVAGREPGWPAAPAPARCVCLTPSDSAGHGRKPALSGEARKPCGAESQASAHLPRPRPQRRPPATGGPAPSAGQARQVLVLVSWRAENGSSSVTAARARPTGGRA